MDLKYANRASAVPAGRRATSADRDPAAAIRGLDHRPLSRL